MVSRKGLQPDPKNTEKVLSWPVPRSPSEVRAFVGLCSYYRRFVKDFSKLAAPLNKLVGKNVPFVWNATCDQSFNHLKNVLSSEPVVILPDFSVPFKIYTDASNLAVGAVMGTSPINALSHSLSEIRAMQNADLDIKTALSWVAHAQRPSRRQLQGASQCLR